MFPVTKNRIASNSAMEFSQVEENNFQKICHFTTSFTYIIIITDSYN